MTVGHIIASLGSGGAEGVLYRLCVADSANSHFVVSFMDEGMYGAPLRHAGIPVHCLHMRRGRLSAHGLRTLWRLLKQQKPDVVQTWMYHADLIGGVVAVMAGVRNVVWGIRSGKLLWRSGQRATSVLRLLNGVLSWVVPARIVCCSARAVEIHQRIGYCRRKFRVVPNGIDVHAFRPDDSGRETLRTAWSIPRGVPLIGAVGRYDPYKAYGDLLEALEQLRRESLHFRCVLIGDGMDADNTELRARLDAGGLSDCVRLCGRRDDIPAVMNALDLYVLSSIAEGFPSVLIEAMACGVPCVTTDVGDAGDIVGDTGWIAPPRDPRALAQGLSHALATLQDADAVMARRDACRRRVIEQFTLGRMVEGYRAVWQTLLTE